MTGRLQIFCDGSAHERRGLPGGWAFVIVDAGSETVRCTDSGGEPRTTSNAMEIHAALAAVRALVLRGWHEEGRVIELISDSRVTLDIITGAIPVPRVHAEAGAELRALCGLANVQTQWVRGHSGNRWNEHVDALAHEAKQALVPLRIKNKVRRLRP